MPRIIENVRGQLVDEARRQVKENGYAAMTVRSVSSACGIAVGTVYNYFRSKEELVAAFMFEDWKQAIERMKDGSRNSSDPMDVIRSVYREYKNYSEAYVKLFEDPRAEEGYSAQFPVRHRMLIDQLSGIIAPACEGHTREELPELPGFIAESMIDWILQKKDFDEYIRIIRQMFI